MHPNNGVRETEHAGGVREDLHGEVGLRRRSVLLAEDHVGHVFFKAASVRERRQPPYDDARVGGAALQAVGDGVS